MSSKIVIKNCHQNLSSKIVINISKALGSLFNVKNQKVAQSLTHSVSHFWFPAFWETCWWHFIDDNFWWQFWWQFLMTIFDDNFWWQFWWQFLMTLFDDHFWWQFLMTIFDDILWKLLWHETWHLRHWLHFWQLRTTIWTITLCPLNIEWWWQHSQFLRCFIWWFGVIHKLSVDPPPLTL